MNCANIWGPSDNSGRLQRPKPHKGALSASPPLCKVGLTNQPIITMSEKVGS